MINEFSPKSFAMQVAENAPLPSKAINVFSESVANDFTSVTIILNQIVAMINSLPADSDIIDGTALYVDSSADGSKDHGIFYNTNRPSTIYEAFLQVLQVLANIENGLKEGAKIGSITAKVTVASGTPRLYSWPYTDKMFQPVLFKESGGVVSQVLPADLSITVTSGAQLEISNSGADVAIWGYVWHPVFTFNR